MNIKLPFGLRKGKLIHISLVESGLACNCACPACGQTLVAKKGDIVEHHFAHHNDLECEGAFETALHIYAKEILEKHERIILPPVYLAGTEKVLFPATEVFFAKVILEKKLNNIIPDLMVYIRDKPLLIEIAVTHFVDKVKESKIAGLGYAAIEIDIRSVLNTLFKRSRAYANFENLLIDDIASKRWINNLKANQINEELKTHYKIKKVTQTEYGKPRLIVYDCPIDKRTWKSGFKKGSSYASVENDCWNCPHREIIRNQKYTTDGTMVTEGKIREVKCTAHRAEELDKIVEEIMKRKP